MPRPKHIQPSEQLSDFDLGSYAFLPGYRRLLVVRAHGRVPDRTSSGGAVDDLEPAPRGEDPWRSW